MAFGWFSFRCSMLLFTKPRNMFVLPLHCFHHVSESLICHTIVQLALNRSSNSVLAYFIIRNFSL